jgi:hypothetical protein
VHTKIPLSLLGSFNSPFCTMIPIKKHKFTSIACLLCRGTRISCLKSGKKNLGKEGCHFRIQASLGLKREIARQGVLPEGVAGNGCDPRGMRFCDPGCFCAKLSLARMVIRIWMMMMITACCEEIGNYIRKVQNFLRSEVFDGLSVRGIHTAR